MIYPTKSLKPRQALCNPRLTRPNWQAQTPRDETLLWLDKNENQDPEHIQFVAQYLKTIPLQAFNTNPDCGVFYETLAHSLSVAPDQLFFGPGSDGVIKAVYETFISPGDVVLYVNPTFAMYSVYAKIFGAEEVAFDYQASPNGPVLDSSQLIDTIRQVKPRLFVLPNPNSPTGTVLSETVLHELMTVTAELNTVMLIDEAYYPYYPKTCLPAIDEFSHIIVTRTFSKAWGLAGIRLGYGIASPAFMKILHLVRPMYEVGNLSLHLGLTALSHESNMLASVDRLNAGKQYFVDELQKLSFNAIACEGNFLHVAFGEYAQCIHESLASKVLYRKAFDHPCLVGYSRFTATTQAQFEPLISTIKGSL